jgi:hypothetical protein
MEVEMAKDEILLDSGPDDTGDTGMDVCLSPMACLCACHDAAAAPAVFLALPLVGLALLRRRSQVVEQLVADGVLPEDLRQRLLEE